MTEHDRGAYTPTPDAPLQFDARGAYKRKPMPMTLIGSAAVLAVLVGALALHYRHDTKPGPEPRPVGAPIAAVKSAPPPTPATVPAPTPAAAAPGGAVDVFGGSSQLAQNTAPAGKAPTFTPPPEAPAPRASLKVQTMENAPPKASPLATTATPSATALATTAKPAPVKAPIAPPAKPTVLAKAGPTPGYHAPGAVAAVAAKPDATSVISRIADAPPPRAGLVSAATPTRSAAAVFGGAMVQIGAFSSMSLSDKGWSDVSALMGPQMSGKLKRVEAVEKDGKTFYRTSVTGFPNREAASAFCRTLSTKHFDCFAKG